MAHNKQEHKKSSLKRYINDLYTKKDAENIFSSMKTSSGRRDMETEMNKYWEDIYRESSNEDHTKYYQEANVLLERIKGKKRAIRGKAYLRYAAAVLLFIATGIGAYLLLRTDGREFVIDYREVIVQNAEHGELVLPDGTHVILNAGSYMRYPTRFTGVHREVMINGEAFFKVKEDKQHPFIVHTNSADIKVLGTSFNVKAYDTDDQFMVCVETGKVQVDMPEAMMRISPNEQIMFNKYNGEFKKEKEDVKRVKSWINKGLYFNKTPIRSVARELQRMYNCKIEFAPGYEYTDFVYGEHDNMSLESVLKSIQYTTSIRYKKEQDYYLLYKD